VNKKYTDRHPRSARRGRATNDFVENNAKVAQQRAKLESALGNIRALADEICAECVPQVYAPALAMWMDRAQEAARKIA
jgi:hypothetical protein